MPAGRGWRNSLVPLRVSSHLTHSRLPFDDTGAGSTSIFAFVCKRANQTRFQCFPLLFLCLQLCNSLF